MGKKILVLDVETTGLEDHDQIIQLAWGWWDGGADVKSRQSFKCMPTIEWKSEWHDKHNLAMEDIDGLPSLDAEIFQPFIEAADSADIFLGYNIDFDLTVVERELERLGLENSYISSKPFIDPMIIWNKSEGHRLIHAYKRWKGSELENAHDAEEDVSGTVAIIPPMLEEFGLNNLTIDDLVLMCDEPDNVDRSGKMKWLDGKPILTCTQFDYYDGKFPNMTLFEAAWSDGGRYARKYPSFKAMGYECHKSVIDAFKIALSHQNDEFGFINSMIEEFGPPPPDEKAESIMIEIQRYLYTVGNGNIRQFVSMCREFQESEFAKEDPIKWAEEITPFDTGEVSSEYHWDKSWLEKYGKDRLRLLGVLVKQIRESLGSYEDYYGCPECGEIYFDEHGKIDGMGGGKIIDDYGGGESHYWVRVGCDTCDFEHYSDSG